MDLGSADGRVVVGVWRVRRQWWQCVGGGGSFSLRVPVPTQDPGLEVGAEAARDGPLLCRGGAGSSRVRAAAAAA